MTYKNKVSDTLDRLKNPVDIICYNVLVQLSTKLYFITHLGYVAKIKYRFAKLLEKLKLRQPVNDDLDFIDRDWEF